MTDKNTQIQRMGSQHPDEVDDLDDLDDLLDDFAEQTLSQPPGAGLNGNSTATITAESIKVENSRGQSAEATTITESISQPSTIKTAKPTDDDPELSIPELDDKFAEQLTSGVDHILKEMESNPEAKGSFERLMKELGAATGAIPKTENGTSASGSNASVGPGGAGNDTPLDFQESIARTMEKLKESNEKSTQNTEDDFLAKMLKDLEKAAGGGAGGPELDGLLAEMLKELSSKEILYEPMREMADKYPKWLEEHGSTLSDEERERYSDQMKIVTSICDKFEEPSYSDFNEAAREYIAQQMEKMQQSGAPPEELMSGLAGGAIPGLGGDFDFSSALEGEANGDVPADCNMQ